MILKSFLHLLYKTIITIVISSFVLEDSQKGKSTKSFILESPDISHSCFYKHIYSILHYDMGRARDIIRTACCKINEELISPGLKENPK